MTQQDGKPPEIGDIRELAATLNRVKNDIAEWLANEPEEPDDLPPELRQQARDLKRELQAFLDGFEKPDADDTGDE